MHIENKFSVFYENLRFHILVTFFFIYSDEREINWSTISIIITYEFSLRPFSIELSKEKKKKSKSSHVLHMNTQ